MSEVADIRNSIAQMSSNGGPLREPTEETVAHAALILALSSIASHLDRIYNRLAHIESKLEDARASEEESQSGNVGRQSTLFTPDTYSR